MNVLSLFDGISCGRIALERAGIKVDNYFASEIDKYAIKVTQKNYPDTIQLGDITQVFAKDLPKIDLLIGGSPCQGFSVAGKQLNFEDPRSKLFFEFVRLLKECNPKYFLLENVRMKKEYKNIISDHLGIEPIEINSNLLSAQNRKRLYWTNIPNITQPEDKLIYLKDILEESVDEEFYVKGKHLKWVLNHLPKEIKSRQININPNKALPLRARTYANWRGTFLFQLPHGYIKSEIKQYDKCPALTFQDFGTKYKICDNNSFRKLTPIECERLQTIPDNYTEGISNTQRYKSLGNGWTVDVIVHILKNIKMEEKR